MKRVLFGFILVILVLVGCMQPGYQPVSQSQQKNVKTESIEPFSLLGYNMQGKDPCPAPGIYHSTTIKFSSNKFKHEIMASTCVDRFRYKFKVYEGLKELRMDLKCYGKDNMRLTLGEIKSEYENPRITPPSTYLEYKSKGKLYRYVYVYIWDLLDLAKIQTEKENTPVFYNVKKGDYTIEIVYGYFNTLEENDIVTCDLILESISPSYSLSKEIQVRYIYDIIKQRRYQ